MHIFTSFENINCKNFQANRQGEFLFQIRLQQIKSQFLCHEQYSTIVSMASTPVYNLLKTAVHVRREDSVGRNREAIYYTEYQ